MLDYTLKGVHMLRYEKDETTCISQVVYCHVNTTVCSISLYHIYPPSKTVGLKVHQKIPTLIGVRK